MGFIVGRLLKEIGVTDDLKRFVGVGGKKTSITPEQSDASIRSNLALRGLSEEEQDFYMKDNPGGGAMLVGQERVDRWKADRLAGHEEQKQLDASVGYLRRMQSYQSSLDTTRGTLNPVGYLRSRRVPESPKGNGSAFSGSTTAARPTFGPMASGGGSINGQRNLQLL